MSKPKTCQYPFSEESCEDPVRYFIGTNKTYFPNYLLSSAEDIRWWGWVCEKHDKWLGMINGHHRWENAS